VRENYCNFEIPSINKSRGFSVTTCDKIPFPVMFQQLIIKN